MDKNLERDLVNFLFFELNKQNFIVSGEIFEFDVQYYIHSFLKFKLKNTFYKVKREKFKTDHVIEYYNQDKKLLNEFNIELKTFIKPQEKLSLKKIHYDIQKLHNKISSCNKNYLLLAIKEIHLAKRTNENFDFIDFLNSNHKKITIVIENNKIKLRIIRSFNTSFQKNGINSIFSSDAYINKYHKNQIRIFLFQLLN